MAWAQFQNLYSVLIVEPIKKLYLNGPMLGMFGFWGGKHKAEICHLLTSIDSRFWINNSRDCDILIEDRFQAFKVTAETVIYFLLLYQLSRFLVVDAPRYLFWIVCCRRRRNRHFLKNNAYDKSGWTSLISNNLNPEWHDDMQPG